MFYFIIVDGGLSEWGEFSSCSVTCGTGHQQRTRACDNPEPAHGGKDCSKDLLTSTRACQSIQCPGKLLLWVLLKRNLSMPLWWIFQNKIDVLSAYLHCVIIQDEQKEISPVS